MPDLSIGAAFALLARREPDVVAVRCGAEVLTRGELEFRADAIARRWIADGVRVDDVVTVCLPNSVAFVVATVAAWKAGATPQPLSPRVSGRERDEVLELTRPAVVVESELPDGLAGGPLPDLAASSWKAPTSSGSTGRPKVVRAAAPARFDPDARVAPFVPRRARQLVAGPLFHAAPFVYAMRGLMAGHELLVLPRFDAGEWLRQVQEHRATWSVLSPATMHRIWRDPARERTDVSSLGSVLHLGARCAPWLKRGWIDWLGAERVQELYAGTESQGLAFVSGEDWLDHPGSVGRALPGSEFRVVHGDGTDCAPGETGEVLMRRDRPTYSYLGAEPVVRDGWHTLGDSGFIDGEGFLFLADRLDDVVTSAGVAIAPADVEGVLEEHPAVRSAVVVGRADDERGQVVHAVIEGDVPEGELREWVRGRLDPEKAPRSYQFVDVPLRDEAGKTRRSSWR